jgi:ketosteroid isomerase-like protein
MFALFMLTALLTPDSAARDAEVASTVIAMERAALARSDKGDVEGFLEISDDDVVYFDPSLEKPIRGLDELSRYYRRNPDYEHAASSEFLNPKVQVAGDVAVLTFNYVTTGERSHKVTRWNATEVYRHARKGWQIIHTHWSYTKPEPGGQP